MLNECTICNFKSEISSNEKVSKKCTNCKALLNLNVKKYDYFNEGGQDNPNILKKKARIKNSDQRFKIIKNIINFPDIFLDIGSGSGEMLEVSKKYFKTHIGYEHDPKLCDDSKLNGLNVMNRNFDKKDLEFLDNLNKYSGVLISFCHVIEHSTNPLELINSIIKHINIDKIIYIEVPLYTGFDFKNNKFKSKLWYDQHFALYHIDTLKYIARKLNFDVLDTGYRTFFSDKFHKKNLIKAYFANPFLSILNIIKNCKKLTIADNLLQNYGYIILKKNRYD